MLQASRRSLIYKHMRLSRLFSFIILLALLLAPASMLGSHAAMAMPQGASASGMNQCDQPQVPEDQDRQAMIDCAIACAAMPAAEPLMASKPVALAPLPTVSPTLILTGTRPEAATPPPRILPRI